MQVAKRVYDQLGLGLLMLLGMVGLAGATEPEGVDTTEIVATIEGAIPAITAVAVAVVTLVVAVKVYKYIKSAL